MGKKLEQFEKWCNEPINEYNPKMVYATDFINDVFSDWKAMNPKSKDAPTLTKVAKSFGLLTTYKYRGDDLHELTIICKDF